MGEKKLCAGRAAAWLLGLGSIVRAQERYPGHWTMAAGDYANACFSALDRITAANAHDLKQVFRFATGGARYVFARP